jgi:hypothetical protein
MRKITTVLIAALSGCAALHDDSACNLSSTNPLASPPANVAALYSLSKNFHPPRAEHHEHWYQPNDQTLVVCRHNERIKGGCASERAEFVLTAHGWQLGPIEVIVCAS